MDNAERTRRARLVWDAVPVKRPLSDREAGALGQHIFAAATVAGSIAGVMMNREDQKVLAEIEEYSRTWLYAEGCLAEERDEVERRIERRTGIYAKCEKTFGPPQYVFAGKLGDIFKTYTGDNPGRHKGGGPFVRFFVEAVNQFGDGFVLSGKPSDIVRRALARQKTWDPKDLWALKII